MRVRIQPIGNVAAASASGRTTTRAAPDTCAAWRGVHVERRPAALAPPALPGVPRGSDVRRFASVSPATTTTRSWCLIARVTAGRGETRPRPAGGRVHTTASSAAVWRGRTCWPRPPAARRRSTSTTGVPAASVEEETGVCPGPPPFACPDASRPRVDRLSSNAQPCDHAIHGGPPSGSDPIQTRSVPPPHRHGPVMPSPARVVVGWNPARREAATRGAPVQGVLRGAPACGAVSPRAARDSARVRRVQPLLGLRATPTGRRRHPERRSGHAGSRRVCPRVWWDRAGFVAAVAGGQGRGRDRDLLGRGTSR